MLNIDTQHLTRDGRRHFSLMPDPRPPARTFRDLLVWQKAHRFVLALYAFTAEFPKQETYGLRSQMRRAAVSIPANIAEGSVEESRYYLILASDLGYGKTDELLAALEEVSRLLNSYARSILSLSRNSYLTARFLRGIKCGANRAKRRPRRFCAPLRG